MSIEKRSMAQAHASMMIANEQANIRRISKEIEFQSKNNFDHANVNERVRSLREERKNHEKRIERIQKAFVPEERKSYVK